MRNEANALAAVHDKIEHIYRELDVQVRRLGQLQAEVDEVRGSLRQLLGESTEPARLRRLDDPPDRVLR